ncbi:MAG: hypothetical protein PHD82_12295, partial [Candidatus Riflebacteria bacterium]|nr:hypothetical protein [Candidatus Riflebacteria bacterium]
LYKSKIFLLTLLLLALTANVQAQSPFSDKPVSISKSSDASASKIEAEKPSLWQRFVKTVKKGYNKLTSTINKVATDEEAPAFVSRSAKIPGHDGYEFVCQGISYLPDQVISPASEQARYRIYKHTLLSYYPEADHTDEPSQLVVVETSTGKPLRRFGLFKSSSEPYTGHAGGIAVAGKYVWVASGYKLYGFKLQNILDFLNDKNAKAGSGNAGIPASLRIPDMDLVAGHIFEVDSKASFVSFDGTQLWVGDFVKASNKSFAPIAHHTQNPFGRNTWIAGYKVDADGLPTATQKYSYKDGTSTRTAYKPDRLIFCRESVQGMAICGKYAALSISYGALNSKLAIYNSPLSKPGTSVKFKPAGQTKTFTAEAWELADGVNWLKTVKLAAGSEDLEFDGRYVYVTFEGASKNYRQKWISINPLVSISERFYLIKPETALKQK